MPPSGDATVVLESNVEKSLNVNRRNDSRSEGYQGETSTTTNVDSEISITRVIESTIPIARSEDNFDCSTNTATSIVVNYKEDIINTNNQGSSNRANTVPALKVQLPETRSISIQTKCFIDQGTSLVSSHQSKNHFGIGIENQSDFNYGNFAVKSNDGVTSFNINTLDYKQQVQEGFYFRKSSRSVQVRPTQNYGESMRHTVSPPGMRTQIANPLYDTDYASDNVSQSKKGVSRQNALDSLEDAEDQTDSSTVIYDDGMRTNTSTVIMTSDQLYDSPMVVAYLVDDGNISDRNDFELSAKEEQARREATTAQKEKEIIEKKFNYMKRFVLLTIILTAIIAIGLVLYFQAGNKTQSQSEYEPFKTTEELYEAVDILFASKSRSVIALQHYGPTINDWDVSRITNFSRLFDPTRGSPFNFASFNDTVVFNESLSKWNTSAATTMHAMFASSVFFDQDLSNWDVRNVYDMSNMFGQTWNLNQNLSKWNTSKVTNMAYMFFNATNFNGDISNWDTKKVTNMSNMFSWCISLDSHSRYTNWDTSSVLQMSGMFQNAQNWGCYNLSDWNVSSVRNMDYMFNNASQFNANISLWNVGNVQSMSHMFANAISFNHDVSLWNVSNVRDMSDMFENALSFDRNLCSWGKQIIGKSVTVIDMFANTGCSNQFDPVVTFGGPYCDQCSLL